MEDVLDCCYYDSANDSCLHATTANATTRDEYVNFYHIAQYVTGLICYPILCVIGLTGNATTLVVLSRKKMVSPTNIFLCALALADGLKLANDFLYFWNQVIRMSDPESASIMMGYMYPISHYIQNASICVSAWLTVSVAMECYISVCHSTRAKEMCTNRRARIVSFAVYFIMSIIALPSAFRYTSVSCYDNQTAKTTYKVILSSLGRNEQFIVIYSWLLNLLRSVIPLMILIVLNAWIIHALRKETMNGKTLSARNRITLMLIIVIVVFLVCVTPDAIMSTVFGFGYVDENNLIKGIREITDVLLAVNSAVNFLVYCGCSRVFRLTYQECLCPFLESRKRSQLHLKSEYIEQSTFTNSNGGVPECSKEGAFNNVTVYIGPHGPQDF